MKITNSAFNMIFPPEPSIRESIFILESRLSEDFPKPFILVPLPNEAPVEFPRISATSRHGFSTLNISLNNFQLVTNFSNDYSVDWKKCKEYVENHVYKLIDIVQPIFRQKPYYCGFTVNLLQKMDGDAVEALKKNFVSPNVNGQIYDYFNRFTFLRDKFYINIQLQNQRIQPNQMLLPGMLKQDEQKNIIGIALDINDRYGFNYNPGYTTSLGNIRSILDLTDDIVRNKLEKFVKEGVNIL
jgi:hypothetical protein